MFWSGRQKRIEARAKSLGDLVLMTRSRLETMGFDEIIEACRRSGLVDNYIDRGKQEYSFFETDTKDADFAFHVNFEERSLMVLGFNRYFKILLTASVSHPTITFEVVPPLLPDPDHMPGPDAAALAVELSKFPGFMDMNKQKAEWGLR